MRKPLLTVLVTLLTLQAAWSQTRLLKDIGVGLGDDMTGGKNQFIKSGDLIYFARKDDKGNEYWRTDGTKEGTFRIADVTKGFGSTVGSTTQFADFDGVLIFHASTNNIWKTDGTEEGTRLIASLSSDGARLTTDKIIKFGNKALIVGRQLDVSNACTVNVYSNDDETITFLKKVGVNLGTVVAASTDERAYFKILNSQNGRYEVWTSDGTVDGTRQLTSVPSLNFTQMVVVNNTLVLMSGNNRITLIDAVNDVELPFFFTSLLGETFVNMYPSGSKVLVASTKSIWVADIAGQDMTAAIPNVRLVDVAFGNNGPYILGQDLTTNHINLYYTDNDFSGAPTIVPLGNASLSFIEKRQIAVVGENIFTVSWSGETGFEPTLVDNTNNVSVLKDIGNGEEGSNPQSFVELNGKILFVASESSGVLELWIGDETGVQRLLDPVTRTDDGVDTRDFNVFNDQVWFLGTDETGTDLWHSTTDASDAVKDMPLNAGFTIGTLNDEFYAWSKNVGFVRIDREGIVSVISKPAEIASSLVHPDDVIKIGNKLIFPMAATTGGVTAGYELWVTDGTEPGTHILKDIFPGTSSPLNNRHLKERLQC